MNNDKIFDYLDRYGVVDKDRFAGRPAKTRRFEKTRRGLRRSIDLHGMKVSEAESAFRSAVYKCRDDGVREILVVHGYGSHSVSRAETGVLKAMVLQMLNNELGPAIKGYRAALPKEGGEGASVVFVL
jgi:DNA-nicking Smr family endonuclease